MLYFRRFFSRGLLPVSRMPHILVPLKKHIFFPLEVAGEREGEGNQEMRQVFSNLSVPPFLKANFHVFGLSPNKPTQKKNFFKRIVACDPDKSRFHLDR